MEFAPPPRFNGLAFDQRIHPPAQRRNVNVDPVVPPIDGVGFIAELRSLIRRQCGRKNFHVVGFEDLLVLQDERLVEINQLFDAHQVPLGPRQWRPAKIQRRRRAIDAPDQDFLRGDGEGAVTLLGNGDSVKACAQPVLQTLLSAIVFAVRERGQFDGAAHVAGVAGRSRQL